MLNPGGLAELGSDFTDKYNTERVPCQVTVLDEKHSNGFCVGGVPCLVQPIFTEAGKSPSRLLGVNRCRTSTPLSVKGIRGRRGPGGLGVVGGFCRGCGGFAGGVLLVGLRGCTLRRVRIHFSSESGLRLGHRDAAPNCFHNFRNDDAPVK